MNSFTDTEIDTLELPKVEEKPKEENIVQPDDKNVIKLVGNKNIVSILTSQFFAEKECDAIVKETVKELWVDSSLKGVRKATQQSLPMNDKGWPYSKVLELAQQANDKNFHVFVGQVGYWLPWNPEADDIANQEYGESQLNELVKAHKQNQDDAQEHFEERKRMLQKDSKVKEIKEDEKEDEKEGGNVKEIIENIF